MAITRAQTFLNRFYSSLPKTANALQNLNERSIIQVKGPDASGFLQGLMTNDIYHLSYGVGSMYTMFLNIKGRILFDTLIYKTEEKDAYLIECDSNASASLQKHLKIYKVKRKVDITNMCEYTVHVLYNGDRDHHLVLQGEYDKTKFPEHSTDLKRHNDLLIFKDPRVPQLGYRIISKNSGNIKDSLQTLIACDTSDNYKKIRYTLGVGEGLDDLLNGSSFPLECNCDYLHGVSFHKGCYVGQELTARTYHTGVIRKRLMPLFFSKIPSELPDKNIMHNNVNLGKLRGIEDNVGLALLRINQALEFGTIAVGNSEATVVKPDWWPIEMPKEKLNVPSTT